jgi:hypothetical protein
MRWLLLDSRLARSYLGPIVERLKVSRCIKHSKVM